MVKQVVEPPMNQYLPSKTAIKIVVIDGHELCLHGFIEVLRRHYSNAEIITIQTAQNALNQVAKSQPNLVVMELALAEKPGLMMRTDTGIQLLRHFLQNYPHLNILVHSAHLRTLVRINPEEINGHQGGFIVADKSLSSYEILMRVNWGLQGLTHTKDIKQISCGLEVNPTWVDVLTLAFQEGLQDKAIAERICVSERMVRHYWDKLQDALGIDGKKLKIQGKNLRILTGNRAREVGLID
jgi:DNA-binding NarL/FixJ family response regulator